MSNKYYITEITKRNKRRHILRKRIRTACAIIGISTFILLLGIVGGLERGTITMAESFIYGILCVSTMWVSMAIGSKLQ